MPKEIRKAEMMADIERLIGWVDGYADSLSNSAHLDMKRIVYYFRKKYGIKTPTFVQFSEMSGGTMKIEDAIKRKLMYVD